jgi:hypothetical protein
MSSLNFKAVASSKSSVNAKRLYSLGTITHIKLKQSIISVDELVVQLLTRFVRLQISLSDRPELQ